MKRKISVFLAVVLCCGICFACGNSEMAGTYRTSFSELGMQKKTYLVLKKNGDFKTYQLGEGEIEESLEAGYNLLSGTFKVKDNKITLNFDYDDPVSGINEKFSISGDVLSDGRIRVTLFGKLSTLKKLD